MERGAVVDSKVAAGGPDALIGRAEPLAALTHRVELATIGRGSFVMVTGPAGIGKSRLCAEVAAALHDRGDVRVIQTACWTHGGAPPLWPWRDLVQRVQGDGSTSPVVAGDATD